MVKVPIVLRDLSTGGCLIESSMKTLPGDRMKLEIDLPGGPTITVEGEPLQIRESVGFSVRFVDVPAAAQRELQRIVNQLSATRPAP